MSTERAYHHGNLRRAVLAAAIEVIREHGPTAVSLRELARRADVSHAAPAHHFTDKTGLLTAIAAEGHHLLADQLGRQRPVGAPEPPISAASATPAASGVATSQGSSTLAELGAVYVRFALEHPAHFEVMFRTDLLRGDDPELVAGRERAGELLRAGVSALLGEAAHPDAALAAWSLAHGYATLLLTGNTTELVAARDPVDVFRTIAGTLFTGPATGQEPR